MSRSKSSQHSPKPKTPAAAGGVPSPPTDPPAASSMTTPLRGQEETNQPVPAGHQPLTGEMTQAAFEFGWQSRLQHDRNTVTGAATFESVEAELAQQWRAGHAERFPWEAARAIAQDAWNKVHEALAEGSQPKS